ncbi:MAG: nucleoside 2-deoxyribosyltransferase [bacterium]|nr:nucleoside 2-deoxyribosyltransferase [bacterium]
MFKPKIYFACSIRGGREDAALYWQLVKYLKMHADVLSEIFVNKKLTLQGMKAPEKDIWKKDMDWIKDADAIIAEVSQPSLGVGYEIAKAETMKKPVLCLYRPSEGKKLSAMIVGSPGVIVVEYNKLSIAEHAIVDFLAKLQPLQTRAV